MGFCTLAPFSEGTLEKTGRKHTLVQDRCYHLWICMHVWWCVLHCVRANGSTCIHETHAGAQESSSRTFKRGRLLWHSEVILDRSNTSALCVHWESNSRRCQGDFVTNFNSVFYALYNCVWWILSIRLPRILESNSVTNCMQQNCPNVCHCKRKHFLFLFTSTGYLSDKPGIIEVTCCLFWVFFFWGGGESGSSQLPLADIWEPLDSAKCTLCEQQYNSAWMIPRGNSRQCLNKQ